MSSLVKSEKGDHVVAVKSIKMQRLLAGWDFLDDFDQDFTSIKSEKSPLVLFDVQNTLNVRNEVRFLA